MYRVARSLLITGVCAVCVTGVQAQGMDWPMYGHDLHHSFATVDSPIRAQNAGSMVRAWVFIPGDVVSASPTVLGEAV
jgi:hypothetical protein